MASGRVSSKYSSVVYLDSFRFLHRHTALREDFRHGLRREGKGIILVHLLLLGEDELVQALLDVQNLLSGLLIVWSQRLGYHVGKGVLLFCRGLFGAAAEAVLPEFPVGFLGVLRVDQNRVNVRAALGKAGEGKTGLCGADNPVPVPRADPVLRLPVSESRFGEGNRTDGAEQILVDFLGVPQIQVVLRLHGHVVGVVEEKNQIIPHIVVSVDDQIIVGVYQVVIGKTAVPQCHEDLLMAAGRFLLDGKFQFQQVVAQGAGEAFPGNLQIFVKFFVLQIQKSLSGR